MGVPAGAIATSDVPAPQARWLYNPSVDLIVGCAAWSAPLLILSGRSLETDARAWSVVFYALALLFNYPHYMATVYRAYHTRSEFARYRIFTLHLTALLAIVGIASHVWSAIVPWIFTVYVTWSPWHYTGQNFGLLMMYARRNGAAPTTLERRALYVSFLSSYLLLFIGFHTGPSSDPLIRSLGLPLLFSELARVALLVLFVVPGFFGLARLAVRVPASAMLAPLTLFATQFMWFVAPAVIEWVTDIRLSQARYSSGVLAIMHSAQYLWVTSYYARREADAESGGTWRPWAYAGTLVAGGSASLALTNAAPGALCVLFVSLSSSPVPFKGGTLYAIPALLQVPLVTSAGGGLSLPFVWPSGVPRYVEFFFQYAIQDAAAVNGVSLSNGLSGLSG